jgi:uncharacterized protein (TIGR00661 family)
MRIAYGIHGYGRGHAGRALAVLAELTKRHEVLLLSGGDTVGLMADFRVVRIPVLSFQYRGPRLSALQTIAKNASLLSSIALGDGPVAEVAAVLRRFQPDAVVSDSEPLVLHAAHRLGIPRVGLDHVGIVSWCRPAAPPADAIQLARDGAVYRLLMGCPERVIVSSFFDAPPRATRVTVVSPILRERVLRAKRHAGKHLLVYFNQPRRLTPQVLAELVQLGLPTIVYGAGGPGRERGVVFKRIDEQSFVEDLAGCRAVFSTAGHQLASEALYLGKPMLLCPEDSAEQRLNARELVRLGAARCLDPRGIQHGAVRAFLEAAEVRPAPGPALAENGTGNGPALAVLEASLRAVVGGAGRADRAWPDGPQPRGTSVTLAAD